MTPNSMLRTIELYTNNTLQQRKLERTKRLNASLPGSGSAVVAAAMSLPTTSSPPGRAPPPPSASNPTTPRPPPKRWVPGTPHTERKRSPNKTSILHQQPREQVHTHPFPVSFSCLLSLRSSTHCYQLRCPHNPI